MAEWTTGAAGTSVAGPPHPMGVAVTLNAEHVLALGMGALLLLCGSFLSCLNSIVAWTLRVLAWLMFATVVLLAP